MMRWAIAVAISLSLCGCIVSKAPERVTQEIVLPAAEGRREAVIVQWPAGVRADQVVTTEQTASNGETRALSVAPAPEETSE